MIKRAPKPSSLMAAYYLAPLIILLVGGIGCLVYSLRRGEWQRNPVGIIVFGLLLIGVGYGAQYFGKIVAAKPYKEDPRPFVATFLWLLVDSLVVFGCIVYPLWQHLKGVK